VSSVVKNSAAAAFALFLLLVFHVFLNLGNGLAVVLGAGVYRIERIGQQKFILLLFVGIAVRGVLQRP